MKRTFQFTIIALCLLISASAFSQKADTVKAEIFTSPPNAKSLVRYDGYAVLRKSDTTLLDRNKKVIPKQDVFLYYIENNKYLWQRKQH